MTTGKVDWKNLGIDAVARTIKGTFGTGKLYHYLKY